MKEREMSFAAEELAGSGEILIVQRENASQGRTSRNKGAERNDVGW
jgi:hypothetical protein